jgi:hypothetical protein
MHLASAVRLIDWTEAACHGASQGRQHEAESQARCEDDKQSNQFAPDLAWARRTSVPQERISNDGTTRPRRLMPSRQRSSGEDFPEVRSILLN